MSQKLLQTLEEVADPSHSALIVIDPQHDFCSEKGAMAQRFGFDMKEIKEAVGHLNRFIETCRKTGVPVIWVREIMADTKLHPNARAHWHFGDDIWIIPEGKKGSEWYEGMIAPKPGEPVVTKWMYDGFEDTDLHLLLQSRGIKTLLMTGFTTNVCVETTARHGFVKGYYIVLVTDCTGAPTPAEYESGVFNMKTYFGQGASSQELADLWAPRSSLSRAS
jgi:nicotinamidase-related amidase